jgi:DNA processing protein
VGESGSQPQLDLPGVDDVFGTARDTERTSDQVRVFDALSGRSARSVPDIARRSGLSMPAVLGALGLLNLDGSVRERETGWVRSS